MTTKVREVNAIRDIPRRLDRKYGAAAFHRERAAVAVRREARRRSEEAKVIRVAVVAILEMILRDNCAHSSASDCGGSR